MINVSLENFDQEVIQASMQVPVLVDFWAPWCGPCKTIGPILEKLETEYQGRFNLVKIDSDQEQELAQAFGIRSIPTCVLLMQGKPVDGFQGAIPESQVREFLDKHVPAAEPQEEEVALEQAPVSPEEQLEAQRLAVTTDPSDDKARTTYLKALLNKGDLAQARTYFEPVADRASTTPAFEALERWMQALSFAAGQKDAAAAVAERDAKISQNKRDFEARFERAQLLWAQKDATGAMDELLEILMRDKAWDDGRARKTYVAVLEAIEPPPVAVEQGKIPPQDPTVTTYRRRLSSVVLS